MTTDNTAAQQNLLSGVGDLLPTNDAAAAALERVESTPLGGAVDKLTNPTDALPTSVADALPDGALPTSVNDALPEGALPTSVAGALPDGALPEGALPTMTPQATPESTGSLADALQPQVEPVTDAAAPAEFIDGSTAPATPAWAAAVVNGAGGRPEASGLEPVPPAFPELNLEAPDAAATGVTEATAAAALAGFTSPQRGRGEAPTAHVPDLPNLGGASMTQPSHAAPTQPAPVQSMPPQAAPLPDTQAPTFATAAPVEPGQPAHTAPHAPSFPLPGNGPSFPSAVESQSGLPPFDAGSPGYPDPALDASFGAPPAPTVGQVPGAPPTADAALAAPQAQDLSSLGMQPGPTGANVEAGNVGFSHDGVPASVAYSSVDDPETELHPYDEPRKGGLSRILKFAALAVGALVLGLLALRLLGIIGGGDDKSIDPADNAATTTTAAGNVATTASTPTSSTTTSEVAVETGPVAGPDYLSEQFTDPKGRFQVGLPAQPEASQQPRTIAGAELQADIFTSTGLDGHEIHVIDYPADVDPSAYSLDALIADLVERFETIGINTSVESSTTVDGYPARQIEFKNAEAVWMGFVTSKDQTSYLAMTKTTPENVAVHQQMVDSWTFTD